MLTDQQRDELREYTRRLLSETCPTDNIRDLPEKSRRDGGQLWRTISELGWPGIHIPGAYGGAGGDPGDLFLVLHEIGRHLAPTTLVSSSLLSAGALLACDSEELRAEMLPDLAVGERIATAVVSDLQGGCAAPRLGVHWSPTPAGIRLDGAAGFVPDAEGADLLVVAARDAAGSIALAVVDAAAAGVTVSGMKLRDRSRQLATVAFDGVVVPESRLLTEPGTGHALQSHIVDLGALAMTADALGGAERVMEETATYASQREQFGRPIGAFQAVKHRCADMVLAVESTRAAVEDAATRVTDAGRGLRVATSIAASVGRDACVQVCGDAVQVHGAVGFTWEHDLHLFLKRARLDAALFGTPSWHRSRLATEVLPEVTEQATQASDVV